MQLKHLFGTGLLIAAGTAFAQGQTPFTVALERLLAVFS